MEVKKTITCSEGTLVLSAEKEIRPREFPRGVLLGTK